MSARERSQKAVNNLMAKQRKGGIISFMETDMQVVEGQIMDVIDANDRCQYYIVEWFNNHPTSKVKTDSNCIVGITE